MSAAAGVRSALRMIFGSTGAAVDSLVATDARIRAGLPLSRRVGFVSLAGGSGTTSVLAAVGATLAGRRSGPILAVDADGGRSGLVRQLIGYAKIDVDATADHEWAERRGAARTIQDARSGLPYAGRLPLLDLNVPTDPSLDRSLKPGAGPARPRSVTEWTGQLGPIARFFDLVLTDWGVRPVAEDLEPVAYSGHVLVLVSRADQPAATAAADAIAALQQLPEPPKLILALADVDRTPTPRRLAPTLADSLAIPVFRLPYDPVIGSGWFHAVGRRSVNSRRAAARLAAGIVTEAARSQAPGRLPRQSATGRHSTNGQVGHPESTEGWVVTPI